MLSPAALGLGSTPPEKVSVRRDTVTHRQAAPCWPPPLQGQPVSSVPGLAGVCSPGIHQSGKDLSPRGCLPGHQRKRRLPGLNNGAGMSLSVWQAGVWGHLMRMPFPLRERRGCAGRAGRGVGPQLEAAASLGNSPEPGPCDLGQGAPSHWASVPHLQHGE